MTENLIKMDDLGVPLFLETPILFKWVETTNYPLDMVFQLPKDSHQLVGFDKNLLNFNSFVTKISSYPITVST